MFKSISKNAINSIKQILVMIIIFVFISFLILLAEYCYPPFLGGVITAIIQHKWLLRCVRWSMIMAFFYLWPLFVNWVCPSSNSIENNAYWQAQRMRFTVWLILFDLIIGENIFLKLFEAW